MKSRPRESGALRPPFVGFVLAALLSGAGFGCSQSSPKYQELRAVEGVLTVGLAEIGAESGRFYTYRSNSGRLIDFLVYRESSGLPHAVLDACRTCYRWRKGYALDGKEVVCIKCGMRFTLDGLAQGTGSCVPILLKTGRRADTLVISASELEAGARFF